MGWPAEALSALCNGEIRGRPSYHAWLVCLSECRHGDRRPVMLEEHSLWCSLLISGMCHTVRVTRLNATYTTFSMIYNYSILV